MTKLVTLRDVVQGSTGTRNPKTSPDEIFSYVDVAAIDNHEKRISGAREVLGADAPSRARKLLRSGDVLVSTVRPNLNAVALVPPELDGQVGSTGFCVLRASPRLILPEYLFYFVRSQHFVENLTALVSGALYPAVSDSQVLAQLLPLPPLDEQRRIVDVLARTEGIVRLRREAQAKAHAIIPALFIDMFGDPAANPMKWQVLPLSDVAEIISGVAKGRKLSAEDSVELPYMRVANVKDGYLDLTEVKTIQIKRSEVDKLLVRRGDLLMTEGGDPDKLGRAALWCGEIEHCVHQNHVFKVRSNHNQILPAFLRSLASGAYGKSYFLSVAKKTTGIASINKTQLSAFPVVLPKIELQERFVKKVASLEAIALLQAASAAKADATFQALLARAFNSAPLSTAPIEEVSVA